MNKVLLVVALLAPFGAIAAALPCSIHPKEGIAGADLPAQAAKAAADLTASKKK
ncbi:MAG: hypothetical protein ABI218_02790 [Caldimonas sp.]